ncbi:MAG: RsmB/NOP family class I SAM-dependent RNA methyltransferase [Verrucomicrobia bacterium]|nr:RsmB/NOP family class I SAM-dependent RNA methyltransferase [Verrucomicrobiota bacterium]
MKSRSFRESHLQHILNAFDQSGGRPLDALLRDYFRLHTAIGSKDRKFLAETVYGVMRWRSLLDYLSEGAASWEKRCAVFLHTPWREQIENRAIPPHIRLSFPKPFYELLSSSLGEMQANTFCLQSNEPAPTTIRANALKISRNDLVEKWKGAPFHMRPCIHSPYGIQFDKRENFFGMAEFKEGLFEVQDEASQLVASLVSAKPGDLFLDYCAGSGGKTLAIAPQMGGRGQIFLHDIRPYALQEAKKRLKRAGIQNAQILPHDSRQHAALRGKMDWVLVDAPCTGTGTLRRNPDMKWKFDEEMLERLIQEQRAIFANALRYLKEGGHIVYATCSVLPQENHSQADYFLKNHPVESIGEPFASFPKKGEMDGFFGIVFKKNSATISPTEDSL